MTDLTQFNAYHEAHAFYYLIAYKPDSVDSIRGCTMATYSSKLETHGPLTQDELIEKLAKLEIASKQTGWGECAYSYQILRNGVLMYDTIDNGNTGYSDYLFSVLGPEMYELENIDRAEELGILFYTELQNILAKVEQLANGGYEEYLAAKQRAIDLERQAEKARKEAKDLADFLKLKEKFEPAD